MDRRCWNLDVNRRDHLVLGGCDMVELARHYGTPLHVVDETRLRDNYHRFHRAFARHYPDVRVYYSYKTNCVPGILSVLHQAGSGAEVVSPYEFWLALRLGVDPSHIIVNGVNKSEDYLTTVVRRKAGLLRVDSAGEIARLKRVLAATGGEVPVGLRIYPEIGWKAQFGLHPERDSFLSLLQGLQDESHVNVCGLHAHIGTNIRSTADYRRTIDTLCAYMRQMKETLNIEVSTVDLGGGFGLPTMKTLTLPETVMYKLFGRPPREPTPERCASLEEFGGEIGVCLKDRCARYGLAEPRLLLEPGRVVTGDAQVLLLTVKDIKRKRHGATYALADGGMQNLAFPLSYEYHHCLVANRASAEKRRRYHIMGSLCSPEDYLYRNWEMPALQENDVLAIMDAGAYFTSFSNNFSFPRPGVVMVSGDSHKLIRRPGNFEHIIAMDIG